MLTGACSSSSSSGGVRVRGIRGRWSLVLQASRVTREAFGCVAAPGCLLQPPSSRYSPHSGLSDPFRRGCHRLQGLVGDCFRGMGTRPLLLRGSYQLVHSVTAD